MDLVKHVVSGNDRCAAALLRQATAPTATAESSQDLAARFRAFVEDLLHAIHQLEALEGIVEVG
jgi:hypothetical protein